MVVTNIDPYLAGQKCCRDGDKCPNNATATFVRGYQLEYWLEQQKTEISLAQERRLSFRKTK